MITLLPVFLLLLTPASTPVSGELQARFRLIKGIVPAAEWLTVPGLPLEDRGEFAEITFSSGTCNSFRVLSSGTTAGITPAVGSYVDNRGYAMSLKVSEFRGTVCDLQERFTGRLSFAGFTADYRGGSGTSQEDQGRSQFYAGYSSRNILVASGRDAGTAGFMVEFDDNLMAGPLVCRQGDQWRFWPFIHSSTGPLSLDLFIAIDGDEDRFSRRAVIRAAAETSAFTAAVEEGEIFCIAEVSCMSSALAALYPDWGFSCTFSPENCVFFFSHSQGGRFNGELQVSLKGVTLGLHTSRRAGGTWSSGILAGYNTGHRSPIEAQSRQGGDYLFHN